MDRRQFMTRAGAAAGLMMLAPQTLLAGARPGRMLVMVELAGGNDGLNTVIPYTNKDYRRLRPSLAIGRDQVLSLSNKAGLHPALEPLMKGWKAGDLAVIQGVGYPKPNRSHFRSIEIWETGSASDSVLTEGWLARLLRGQVPPGHAAEGISLDGEDAGPLAGGDRTLVMRDPEQFIRAARRLSPIEARSPNAALAHVLAVQDDLIRGAQIIDAKLTRAARIKTRFPAGPFGKQLQRAAQLILAGVPTSAIKVTLGGFDTHAGQLGAHQRLMTQLGLGLAALREALIVGGAWDRVLVMTYSEFGRRAAENGSGGTDHGTAAPHFALGGRVKCGLYGAQPSLTDLQGGDLRHAVDFRSLHATAARGWFGLPASRLPGGGHKMLPILRG